MALNWNMIPALAGAEGAGAGYQQGMSNYMKTMNDIIYRRSEIERNTAMAQAYSNRYGQNGLSQQGIDERTIAAILRANPGMTYGQAVGQMGGGGAQGGGQQMPGWVSQMGGQQSQGDGSSYLPPWVQQAQPQQPVADLGGMPDGFAPPPLGAGQQPTPSASPQQSGGPVSTEAAPQRMGTPNQSPPSMSPVDASNPMMSMLMTAAKYANQPGAQPGQVQPPATATTDTPAQNMWYNKTAQSPLAPVGGQGGFDWGKADADTAQGALATIQKYQSLLQDPNAPQDPNSNAYWQYQGMLRQGAPAYKEAMTVLNDVQGRHTQGLQAMLGAGKDVAAATEKYNQGGMNGSDYAQLMNYYRSQGVNYEPAMRPVNAGLSPQQMNDLAIAAQKGTLTPAQQKMIPQGYTLAADDQGNPVFVDKNGIEQEVGSGLTDTAKAGLAQKQAQTSHLKELTTQIQKLLPNKIAISDTKAKYLPLMDEQTLAKIKQEIELNKDKIAVEPQMLDSIIARNGAAAGYMNAQGEWVGAKAQAGIARDYAQAGSYGANSQTNMTRTQIDALTKRDSARNAALAMTQPQKDPWTGQPVPGSESITIDASGPHGSPAALQAYNQHMADAKKFNDIGYQEGQRAMHPPAQPTVSQNGQPTPAGPVPPIVSYILNHAGETCKGTQCGSTIEKLVGAPIGQGVIQGWINNRPVKPDTNGNVPDGTGVHFGGSSTNNRHYGIIYTGSDGRKYLAEAHDNGDRVWKYDGSRLFDDVRNENAHRNYKVEYFAIPQRGVNAPSSGTSRIKSAMGSMSSNVKSPAASKFLSIVGP